MECDQHYGIAFVEVLVLITLVMLACGLPVVVRFGATPSHTSCKDTSVAVYAGTHAPTIKVVRCAQYVGVGK